MARHVCTCPGFFNSYNMDNFGGAPFRSPNTVWDQPSDAPGLTGTWGNLSLANSAAVSDVNDMDAMLQQAILASASLPVLMFGHSRGGQMIYKWFRDKMPNSPIDPGQVRFIASGVPESRYGGASKNNYAAHPPSYPGGVEGVDWGLPDDLGGHELWCVTRIYDRYSDYPNDYYNTAAMNHLMALNEAPAVHSTYDLAPPFTDEGLPADLSQWSVYEEGGATYLTSWSDPIVPVPAPTPLALTFGGELQEARYETVWFNDRIARDPIESAYNRPRPYRLNLDAAT